MVVPGLLAKTRPLFEDARKELHGLIETAKAYPYYKYNHMWTRDLQTLVCPPPPPADWPPADCPA